MGILAYPETEEDIPRMVGDEFNIIQVTKLSEQEGFV